MNQLSCSDDKRRQDTLWGRQSAAELEEEALSLGNEAMTLTVPEILQLCLLEADRCARGAEIPPRQ